MPQRRRPLGCYAAGAVLLLLAPILLYSSWCWGWWGLGNPWLQYFFDCRCPAASEPSRYPPSVEVVVSACREPTILGLSPSGRYMTVDVHAPQRERYNLDFQTGAVEDLPTNYDFVYLTDDLWVMSDGIDAFLVDRETRAQTPFTVLSPNRVPGGELADGTGNPEALLPLFRSTSQIFVGSDKVLVVEGRLTSASPPGHYIFSQGWWWPERLFVSGGALQQFLDAHQIAYHLLLRQIAYTWPSHSGEYAAYWDGIVRTQTGERVVENYRPGGVNFDVPPYGWAFEDRGVLLSPLTRWLIDIRLFGSVLIQAGRVPMPLLLLKAPAVDER
jgi:hypothetical protein